MKYCHSFSITIPMKKPIPVFWMHDLLNYVIGTTQNPETWANRSELQEWIRCNSVQVFEGVYICHVTEYPYTSPAYTTDITKSFTSQILDEFGIHDYEIDPLQPCGGWRSVDILHYNPNT